MTLAEPSLLGREEELAAVRELFDDSSSGLLVLEGEAGIGKTRILGEAIELGRKRHFDVCRGEGAGLDAAPPLHLFLPLLNDDRRGRSLLERMRRHRSTALRVDDARAADMSLEVIDTTTDVLEARAAKDRLLLVLDDLHWADPLSLLTLVEIVRRAPELGLALVVALRPSPRTAPIDHAVDALRRNGATQRSLQPLGSADTERLIDELVGHPPSEGLLDVAARANGNPFYIVELMNALQQEGRLSTAGDTVDIIGSSLPDSLRSTVLRRVRLLGEPTADVLRTAAVLGPTIDVDELAAVTGLRVHELAGRLADAAGAGVLVEQDSVLQFRHDLLRDAIVEDTPGVVREALHRTAAAELSRRDAAPERVATHVLLGARPGDAEAVAAVRKAAATASHSVAADLLEQARALCSQDDPQRAEVSAELAIAWLWTGQVEQAVQLAEAVLPAVEDVAVRRLLRTTWLFALFILGEPARAVQWWRELDTTAPEDQLELGRELGSVALGALFAGETADADALAVESLTLLPDDGPPSTAAHATLAWVGALRSDYDGGLEHADAAVAAADRSERLSEHFYRPLLLRSMVLDSVGRPSDALADLRRNAEIAYELGTAPLEITVHHASQAVVLYRLGDWDQATAVSGAGLQASSESGLHLVDAWLAAVSGLVSVHRNELDRAEEVLQPVLDGRPRPGADWAMWAQSQLWWARGDPSMALMLLEAVVATVQAMGASALLTNIGPDVVRLARIVGEPHRADLLRTGLALDDAAPPVIRATIAACHAHAAGDAEAMLVAAEQLDAIPRPFQAARLREDAAVVLAEQRDADRARATAREALHVYDELRAVSCAARLRADLRQLGIRVRTHASGVRLGPEVLTPTEELVADLVGQGLANAEIADRLQVSRRTVESHVGRIYAKLGLSGRSALVAQRAAGRGEPR